MSDAEYVPQAWRMTDYYPDSYAKFMSALGIGIDYDDADFDRYHAEFLADLSEHDRQVAERAWGEGYEAAAGFHEGREKGHWENDFPAKGMRTWRPDPVPTSPYRAAKEEQSNG